MTGKIVISFFFENLGQKVGFLIFSEIWWPKKKIIKNFKNIFQKNSATKSLTRIFPSIIWWKKILNVKLFKSITNPDAHPGRAFELTLKYLGKYNRFEKLVHMKLFIFWIIFIFLEFSFFKNPFHHDNIFIGIWQELHNNVVGLKAFTTLLIR